LNIGIVLTLVGLVDMLTEGYLVRRLLPLMGELPLSYIGIIVTALGMVLVAGVAVSASAGLLYGAVIVYSVGDGLFEPAINGLIANATPPHMHGQVQGASQGTQSIARFVAPLLAGVLYEWAPFLPYLSAAVLMMFSLAIVLFFRRSLAR
jgi:DHA1 family tetracycline resistance protein-like MFS transporter